MLVVVVVIVVVVVVVVFVVGREDNSKHWMLKPRRHCLEIEKWNFTQNWIKTSVIYIVIYMAFLDPTVKQHIVR